MKKDRLKILLCKLYYLASNPYDEKGKELLPYTKINMMSAVFIGFKPLEELSLVLDFIYVNDFLEVSLVKRKKEIYIIDF